MITDSYDDKSPAKINIKKNENAVQVDAVIYTFSEEIEKYVIAHYPYPSEQIIQIVSLYLC